MVRAVLSQRQLARRPATNTWACLITSEMGLVVARVPLNMSIKVTKIVYQSTCEDGGVKHVAGNRFRDYLSDQTHVHPERNCMHMPVEVTTYWTSWEPVANQIFKASYWWKIPCRRICCLFADVSSPLSFCFSLSRIRIHEASALMCKLSTRQVVNQLKK